jgi:hypothetical protein
VEDDETEDILRGRASDVSFLLDERDIEHDTFVQSDGEEGWHLVITAGHAIHGSPLREYTLTYASRDAAWTCQAVAEDGESVGPHSVPSLDATSSAVEIADHIAAEVAGDA